MEATTTTATKKYLVDVSKKEQFVGILLLSYLNEGGKIPILMDGDFKVLEPLLIKLNAKGYVCVSGDSYKTTASGVAVFKTFLQRYSEYLKVYDIFCAVDLGTGEFALKKVFDIVDDEEWHMYLNLPRWIDVRVAVAEFKKLDPCEIVFMSFIQEGRFYLKKTGWQFDIYAGLIWSEVENICNTAYTVDDINQGDSTIIENIISEGISEGAKVAVELIKAEEERNKKAAEAEAANAGQEEPDAEETTVVTTTEYVNVDDFQQPYGYYERYYNPLYVNPIFVAALFLL